MPLHGLPPIAIIDSEVLILGTFPSEESLKKARYYANKRNQFWKIMNYVLSSKDSENSNEQRRLLGQFKVALWDVLCECERNGSADSSIMRGTEKANDLCGFLRLHDSIKSIYFNGEKSFQYFSMLIEGSCSAELHEIGKIVLPSSSSANTWYTLMQKQEIWKSKMDIRKISTER